MACNLHVLPLPPLVVCTAFITSDDDDDEANKSNFI
jgi:hypothetical protein